MDIHEKNYCPINGLSREITHMVSLWIECFENESPFTKDTVISELHRMLNGNFEKYNFSVFFPSQNTDTISGKQIDQYLAKLSEKKKDGVFYTPKDVVDYILINLIMGEFLHFDERVFSFDDGISILEKIPQTSLDLLLFEKTFFDPTSGAGEFLTSIFDLKIRLLKQRDPRNSDDDILLILSTIYGNDINQEAVEIQKIRLFFSSLAQLSKAESIPKLVSILNKNISCMDFFELKDPSPKYDFIAGNPPYLETPKSSAEKKGLHFGNIYADILSICSDHVNETGGIGFIVPISLVSTTRMEKLREKLSKQFSRQIVLNYSDRPGCLFSGVHQKLTIYLGLSAPEKVGFFSSSYQYWYKSERDSLLSTKMIQKIDQMDFPFWPKIGNVLEKKVFYRVTSLSSPTLLSVMGMSTGKEIFLNMRACFWMKAFSFFPGSKEYKRFLIDEKYRNYTLCVLNSSLFFVYWIISSDCWHITKRELSLFKLALPSEEKKAVFDKLISELEDQLEKTKKFIGSKQVSYAYKHKECKEIINRIDWELKGVFQLTDDEEHMIQTFAEKYRVSNDEV